MSRAGGPILFVSWTPHARVTAVANDIGAEVMIPAAWVLRRPWPVRYFLQSLATAFSLAQRRPRSVIFTNPPFVVGAALLAMRLPLRFSLWADCHSGVFNDPRWARFGRLNAFVLKRCTGVSFHNNSQASEFGSLCRQHLVVCSWRIIDRRPQRTAADAHRRSSR